MDGRMKQGDSLRVAIVCDWLVTYAGAERVLEQLLQIYPEADVFALIDFLPKGQRFFLKGKPVHTTFLQKLPGARRRYRSFLPLMPLAIEQLDLSGYGLIISSSHAVAKGILVGPDQLHISYIHSPIRYAWDMQHQYLKESGMEHSLKGWMARSILHYLRLWDVRTANGVDHFVANSRFIARRIEKCYRRRATVIHPPVDIDKYSLCADKADYYMTASRMVPYKKVKLIAEAFRKMPEKKLVVIGDGPDFEEVKHLASRNVELLGYQPDEVLREKMQQAKAFVFAAEEDFGILPVEAQACGTPVIAYGKGGILDTVRPLGDEHPTGIFFQEQNVEAICGAVREFEESGKTIQSEDCRLNAERFGQEVFRCQFRTFVDEKLEAWHRQEGIGGMIHAHCH